MSLSHVLVTVGNYALYAPSYSTTPLRSAYSNRGSMYPLKPMQNYFLPWFPFEDLTFCWLQNMLLLLMGCILCFAVALRRSVAKKDLSSYCHSHINSHLSFLTRKIFEWKTKSRLLNANLLGERFGWLSLIETSKVTSSLLFLRPIL